MRGAGTRQGLIRLLRPCLLVILLLLSLAAPIAAQPTNVAVYQDLARRCLAEAPDTSQAFRLETPERMPYLRTALVEQWQRDGYAIFLVDSTSSNANNLPQLGYIIEEVDVRYERAERGQLQRVATLGLRYTLTAPNGRLLHEARCRERFEDTFSRDQVGTIESAAFPETQADVPQKAGWFRRYLEPAVLTAATGVAIYLFFSLRSDRANNEL